MLAHRPRPRSVAVVTALLVALAACTGPGPDAGPDHPPAASSTAAPGPRPDDVVATETITVQEAELDVAVHPFVRAGDHVVLTLDITPRGPVEDRIQLTAFGKHGHDGLHDIVNLRAFDLERDVVLHPAVDADGDPVVTPPRWPFLPAEGGRVQVAYAAPEADALALLLPGAPLVVDVPVVDGDVPSGAAASSGPAPTGSSGTAARPTATADAAPGLDLASIAAADVFPLESHVIELEGAVRTVESTQEVQLALDTDVLFEFDQAALTPQAADVLALAAGRISEREPGTVLVVGHTDDQGDDAYNLDLSRRRAQAVADALAGLLDTARYPAGVEGRGESEPFVTNDSDENRALNRRVTLTLVSTVVTRTDLTTTGELPPFREGVVAPAGAPVRHVSGPRPWDVEASARRVAGHVVADVRVTARDDRSHLGNVPFLNAQFGNRGAGTGAPQSTSNRATVLVGATRMYALDYRLESGDWPGGVWLPAANLWGSVDLAEGQSTVLTYVFPRLDSPTVTLQFGNGGRDDDLRLVDVPVED